MKYLFSKLCAVSLVFFWISSAVASGGEHAVHGPDKKFLFVVINFLILALLVVMGTRKPAREFFRTRSLLSKKRLEDAKKLHDDARRQHEEIQAKLKNADSEGKDLIASVKRQAEQEMQAMVAQGHELSEKIKQDTQRMISQEIARARNELKSEAVELAMDLAVQKIKGSLSVEDQVQLGSDFVSGVKTVRVS